jgi:hypothetical protein
MKSSPNVILATPKHARKPKQKPVAAQIYSTLEGGAGGGIEVGRKAASIPFTLGSDPELMLWDKKVGKIVSSLNVLKKDKHEPIDLGNGVAMYADCTLVETSFSPVTGFGPIVDRFNEVFHRMYEGLDKIEKGQYSLIPQASHVFDEVELAGDKRANEIGCDPSYEAYLRCIHHPDPFKDGLRTGSLHLHVGRADWKKPTDQRLMSMESKEEVIKLLDVFVGCASVIICKDDTAPARRALYGKAGSFRPTDYGVEMRCLDPYAMKTPELLRLIWDLVEHSIQYLERDAIPALLAKVDEKEVQTAINEYDRPLARKVIKQAGLSGGLMARIERNYAAPSFEMAWGLRA